ncbi:DUF4446 family protein [Thermoanaerobacterium sp. RBIITD]|uniref:DUF4446 family protein n=1 Tax=Thermoanaerobacterium sp. RBIITD TaxID=1550240 RepID=UPI000BB74126|nr:DUF4446 family protein [Thermoanaerobacterium sp. RBIITD]SNX53768.1 Protein of unknown function [Thermoanaerobacterium sp. RBIITD]
MQQLMTLLEKNIGLFILFAIALGLFDLIVVTIINSKYTKLKKQYKRVMKELETGDILDILSKDIMKNEEFNEKLDKFRKELSFIDNEMKTSIKKVGIVRYNAFNDVGSDLSFSIALLDSNDNGVVISGIYGRNETATFAKPIMKAQSNYPLSAEEIQAIDKARKGQ